MSDYIKREDAIDVLVETITPPSITLDTLIMRMDDTPSADVVKVVRCKNCKYKEHERCGLTKYTVREHDYCSYGEENSK